MLDNGIRVVRGVPTSSHLLIDHGDVSLYGTLLTYPTFYLKETGKDELLLEADTLVVLRIFCDRHGYTYDVSESALRESNRLEAEESSKMAKQLLRQMEQDAVKQYIDDYMAFPALGLFNKTRSELVSEIIDIVQDINVPLGMHVDDDSYISRLKENNLLRLSLLLSVIHDMPDVTDISEDD